MKHTDWYERAQEELSRLASGVQQRQRLNLEEVSRLATTLIDSLQKGDRLVIEALSGPAGPPLITNLLNVGILTTKVGMGLGYYGADLHRLATAALVHDIGIFSIPQNILTKTGRLTPDERILIEEHPRLGSEIIRQSGESYHWLADVVLQAHERWMGQGYPNKRKGREINELAQMIGVVDVFDALVSPRPYRRRFLPHEAMRELFMNERNAFPREVIKALVEQLSVYPLGTKVQLNTGEQGIVIGINPKYPSRPLITIDRDHASQSAEAARVLDLSQAPSVWITQALTSPDMAHMTPTFTEPGRATVEQPVRSSDQFAALLESLDAIANVIQTAVETREVIGPAMPPAAPLAAEHGASQVSAQQIVDTAIDKEVLGLFALEAREWIRQIQAALVTLDQTVEKERQADLLKIMLDGMINLAKSAATVPAPAIEHMVFDLIPLLDSVGRQHRTITAPHLEMVHEGLSRLASAIRELPCESPNGEQTEPVEESSATARPTESLSAHADQQVTPERVEPAGSILDALRRLHEAPSRSIRPMRDILDEVIRRAEQIEPLTDSIDVRTIGRILNDLDLVDTEFLNHVTGRVLTIVEKLTGLTTKRDHAPLFTVGLDSIMQDIEALHESAERVSAAAIMLFLQGLRGFLLVAARSNPPDLSRRLHAAQDRVTALMPLAKQWVDIGRIERASIIDILPV
ncbi:MAG: HD-GYP domain-containing protein [Nitrospiraceae bacterium]